MPITAFLCTAIHFYNVRWVCVCVCVSVRGEKFSPIVANNEREFCLDKFCHGNYRFHFTRCVNRIGLQINRTKHSTTTTTKFNSEARRIVCAVWPICIANMQTIEFQNYFLL